MDIKCHNCNKILVAKPEHVGQMAECPACGCDVKVPLDAETKSIDKEFDFHEQQRHQQQHESVGISSNNYAGRIKRNVLALVVVLIVVKACIPSSPDPSIPPLKALNIAQSFKMKSNISEAHQTALLQGLKKLKSRKQDDLRIVEYKGTARTKLTFCKDGWLTRVRVKITNFKGDIYYASNFNLDGELSQTAEALNHTLGRPSSIYGFGSSYMAGEMFDATVYADWPYFVLTYNEKGIWIERSWAR